VSEADTDVAVLPVTEEGDVAAEVMDVQLVYVPEVVE
jgi:hypothetical protein